MISVQISIVDASALPRSRWRDRVAEDVWLAGLTYRDMYAGRGSCFLVIMRIEAHTGAPGNSVATRDDVRTP